MSINCSCLFLVIFFSLVAFNLFFFYALNNENEPVSSLLSGIVLKPTPSAIRDIEEYLHYLPKKYTIKNRKFNYIQRFLIDAFNATSYTKPQNVQEYIERFQPQDSLFPIENGAAGLVLQTIQSSLIVLVDNAPKGSQLKLLLILENSQKIFFKPKRYSPDEIINGTIYAGFDRHNSEVFAYYLAIILDFKWIAPATMRKIHFKNDILNCGTLGLRKTMRRNGNGQTCIYGKCFYCNVNDTVCPNDEGYIEGAAILYFDKHFSVQKSPWLRSYRNKRLEWQINDDYCMSLMPAIDKTKLLNFVDVSIFDFLIQNGDRHHYEMYKGKVVLVDNGKGLGNPHYDEIDILAPLYQCCILSHSTWRRLELLSGGTLTDTIKILAALHGNRVATKAHYRAVERRLLIVYATVQYCIGKHGSAKVFSY